MNTAFKQLDLDAVSAGMLLWDSVLDAHGGVLLPSGTALTDAMLSSLSRRGIDVVCVKNDDLSEEELRAVRERVQLRLDRLFRRCRDCGASAALLERVAAYRFGAA
jgi:hypothetical protein